MVRARVSGVFFRVVYDEKEIVSWIKAATRSTTKRTKVTFGSGVTVFQMCAATIQNASIILLPWSLRPARGVVWFVPGWTKMLLSHFCVLCAWGLRIRYNDVSKIIRVEDTRGVGLYRKLKVEYFWVRYLSE